jgi:hypothetical protein
MPGRQGADVDMRFEGKNIPVKRSGAARAGDLIAPVHVAVPKGAADCRKKCANFKKLEVFVTLRRPRTPAATSP